MMHLEISIGSRPLKRARRSGAAAGIVLLFAALAALAITSKPSSVAPSATSSDRPAIDADLDRVLLLANPELSPSQRARAVRAVLRSSRRYHLDPTLVTAVILVESTARPWVSSMSGAMGLMQVMPHMIEPLDLAGNSYTIESNVEAGCWILAHNIKLWGEDKGVSAYFWGSDVRGFAYLERVRSAQSYVRYQSTS